MSFDKWTGKVPKPRAVRCDLSCLANTNGRFHSVLRKQGVYTAYPWGLARLKGVVLN